MKKLCKHLVAIFAIMLWTPNANAVDYAIQHYSSRSIEGKPSSFSFGTVPPEVGSIYTAGKLYDFPTWKSSKFFGRNNPQGYVWETDERKVYQVEAIFTVPVGPDKFRPENIVTLQNVDRMLPDATHEQKSAKPGVLTVVSKMTMPEEFLPFLKLQGKEGFVQMTSNVFFSANPGQAFHNRFFQNDTPIFDGNLTGVLFQQSHKFNQIGVFGTTATLLYEHPTDRNKTVVVVSSAFAITLAYFELSNGEGEKLIMGQPAVIRKGGLTATFDPAKETGLMAGLPKYIDNILLSTAALLVEFE